VDKFLKSLEVDKFNSEKLLDFLPYPFIVAEKREGVHQNVYFNKKFIEEIGYTREEIPTIDEWFQLAYPNPSYRKEIADEWARGEIIAKKTGQEFVTMQVKVQTKNHGAIWYEVKASIYGSVHFVALMNIHKEVMREQELQRLNDNKDKILSILSHDLRAPLKSLQGILELNTKDTLSEIEKIKFLKHLKEQVFQMGEFLDTTLNWTRLNFSELKPVHEVIDIHKIAEAILNLYSTSCVNKKIQTKLTLTNKVNVMGDPEIFSIVFRNLISNAVKFTPERGHIHIYDSSRDNKYVLAVENSGWGLNQEKISRIFDKTSVSEIGTNGEKGLGVGLKLCLQLLEKTGNNLEAMGETQKAIFRIVL
jgi:K+-sensing histidine kinase KdpD